MNPEARIGMIGVGKMGGGIARNITRAGVDLLCFDREPGTLATAVADGGERASDVEQILEECDIVMTCVWGRHSVPLYDDILMPGARSGQTFIDHATIPVLDTRRIGHELVEKGARYLDAPISGGRVGADAGSLRIFVGGERSVAQECWPLFEAAGDPEKIVYCGDTGTGQIVKVVQQMAGRLPALAQLEIVQFGVKSGLPIDTIRKALDVEKDGNDPYARLCREVESGEIASRDYEFPEWAYYFQQARAEGFSMPMLEAVYEAVKDGEATVVDGAGRMGPSVWTELMKG